jgi:hypothetical protein
MLEAAIQTGKDEGQGMLFRKPVRVLMHHAASIYSYASELETEAI